MVKLWRISMMPSPCRTRASEAPRWWRCRATQSDRRRARRQYRWRRPPAPLSRPAFPVEFPEFPSGPSRDPSLQFAHQYCCPDTLNLATWAESGRYLAADLIIAHFAVGPVLRLAAFRAKGSVLVGFNFCLCRRLICGAPGIPLAVASVAYSVLRCSLRRHSPDRQSPR